MVVLQAEGLLVPTTQNDCWQVGKRGGGFQRLETTAGQMVGTCAACSVAVIK